jgi:phenylalanyl-tRNA synthetase beta chain
MIISYKWLHEYLPETLPTKELTDILTSIGLEVESVETIEAIPGGLEGLVIGEVVSCKKHPNADKLSVTEVHIGNENILNIVCGAPNVALGQKVIVAPVGTTVYPLSGEPFLIKKAKIRGADSEGMICAEDEIGLGQSHAGIIVLPQDAPVGTLAKVYYNIPEADKAVHIGLTPNRSDAMSHIGVARDICAFMTHHTGKPYTVKVPDTVLPAKSSNEIKISVQIDAEKACPRYTGISISNVKIGPSPEWLQQRLNAVGLRSINNVVDITNYVLHEFGQPLHAFDADKIKGNKVNVRFLPQGTKFITLDEKERVLNGNDLMICDAQEGMCIAGVFGGIHSGVTDTTTNIFLESAYFDPAHIRRTSLFHNLRTDAATHFEKGVDMNNVLPALKRAAALICGITGGSIASDIVDVYPEPLKQVSVDVTYSYIQKLSGKEYPNASVQKILKALGFEFTNENNNGFTVKVPSNKTDVSQPADIVEEIVRIDGLNNIPIPDRLNISLNKPTANDKQSRERIAELLCGMGLQEIVTNSITNSKFYPGNGNLVRMMNSLSSELDVMRPSMLESGLEVIQYNCNRKNSDLALFEFGNIYAVENGKYIQQPQLAVWITGNTRPAQWNTKAQLTDIYYLKGLIRDILSYSDIKKFSLLHDGNTIRWMQGNKELCSAYSVPEARLQEFDIKQDVFFAVINWETLQELAIQQKIKYSEVPKFPAVQRDLAVVLDKTVSYDQVQKVTEQLRLDALRSFDLFDVFESEKLGAGKKSYALSYTFQLQDRTLTDSETEQLMSQLINAYKTKLQAQIRE